MRRRVNQLESLAPVLGAIPLLEDRRERFCLELLKDDNQTQAAIRSGYSPASARRQGSRLSTNAHVAARVAYLRGQRSTRIQVAIEELDARLEAMALFEGDPASPDAAGVAYVEVEQREVWTKDGLQTHTTKRFRTPDRVKATAELYKRKGAYRQDDGPRRPGEGGIVVAVLAGAGVVQPPPPPSGPGKIVNGVLVLSKEAADPS